MQLLKEKIGAETLMFGFGQAMFAVEEDVCTTRYDESPFFAEQRPFLVRISLILVSGRGLMNSLHPVPEILALITEAEGRKGEKAKQQPSNRETETERVCQLVRLRSLSEEEEKRSREKRLSEPRKSATNDDPFSPLSLSFVSLGILLPFGDGACSVARCRKFYLP